MSPPSDPITVVASPTVTNTPTKTTLPIPQAASSPVQYRIEERRRTIYLTSSLPPGEWDSKALGELLSLPEIPDEQGAQSEGRAQRERRAKSLSENDLVVLRDNSVQKSKDVPGNSPRSLRHGRHLGIPKGGGSSSTPTTPTGTIRAGLPRTHRILFYHRHDPHYGFTNFSPHPVVFNGKKYPTSEHLFQSFKVCSALHYHDQMSLTILASFKDTAQILQSMFEHAPRGQVSPFQKHVDSNPKSDPIG